MTKLGRALGETFSPADILPREDVDSLGPTWLAASTDDLPELPGTDAAKIRTSAPGEHEEH